MRAMEIRQLIALTEPRVFELIRAVAEDPSTPLDSRNASALAALGLDKIEEWANQVRQKAQQTADTGYLAYETIKIGEVLADLSAGLCLLFGYPLGSRHAALVHRLVRRWRRARSTCWTRPAPAIRKWWGHTGKTLKAGSRF